MIRIRKLGFSFGVRGETRYVTAAYLGALARGIDRRRPDAYAPGVGLGPGRGIDSRVTIRDSQWDVDCNSIEPASVDRAHREQIHIVHMSSPTLSADPGAARAAPPPGRSSDLSAEEIRSRVRTGLVAVGLRALGVRAIGLLTNVVLARLLLPRDFGILAFGQTLVMFGSLLTDIGMSAGLIRQDRPPTVAQLESFYALQLFTTTGFVAIAIAALLPFGRLGHVGAVMTASLILSSVGGSRVIVLERDLDYGAIAAADVSSGFVYCVAAILLVALGAGIWGVAAAHILRAASQSAVLLRRTSHVRLRPRLSLEQLRGMVAFGVKFQANSLLDLGRAEGINVLTLAIAGTGVLGLWSLAQRILLIPYLMFEALWRVSFPAIARLVAKGVDPSAEVARALGLGVVATGGLLVGFASSAPSLVPAIFGPAWRDSAQVIPLASLGITVAGPISAAYGGYLYAVGKAGWVLAASAVAVVCWFVLLPLLLPTIGPTAHGVAWLAASIGEATLLTAALGRRAARDAIHTVVPPVAVGTVIAGLALRLKPELPSSLPSAVAVAVVATLLYGALLTVIRRDTCRDLFRLAMRMVQPATGRLRSAVPAGES